VGGSPQKFLARHPENEDVDLVIRFEAAARRSLSRKFFVPSSKMTLSLATMLHSEFPITAT
jgi:hypothetical protein